MEPRRRQSLRRGLPTTHVYTQPGTYPVNLTVQSHTSFTRDIIIKPGFITVTASGSTGSGLHRDADEWRQPAERRFHGHFLRIRRRVGCGTSVTQAPRQPSQNPSHIYTTPGTYTVTLVATNAAGASPIGDQDELHHGDDSGGTARGELHRDADKRHRTAERCLHGYFLELADELVVGLR